MKQRVLLLITLLGLSILLNGVVKTQSDETVAPIFTEVKNIEFNTTHGAPRIIIYPDLYFGVFNPNGQTEISFDQLSNTICDIDFKLIVEQTSSNHSTSDCVRTNDSSITISNGVSFINQSTLIDYYSTLSFSFDKRLDTANNLTLTIDNYVSNVALSFEPNSVNGYNITNISSLDGYEESPDYLTHQYSTNFNDRENASQYIESINETQSISNLTIFPIMSDITLTLSNFNTQTVLRINAEGVIHNYTPEPIQIRAPCVDWIPVYLTLNSTGSTGEYSDYWYFRGACHTAVEFYEVAAGSKNTYSVLAFFQLHGSHYPIFVDGNYSLQLHLYNFYQYNVELDERAKYLSTELRIKGESMEIVYPNKDFSIYQQTDSSNSQQTDTSNSSINPLTSSDISIIYFSTVILFIVLDNRIRSKYNKK